MLQDSTLYDEELLEELLVLWYARFNLCYCIKAIYLNGSLMIYRVFQKLVFIGLNFTNYLKKSLL